jgi:2-oxoglutarate dehydrogenase E2 component (dihydrolipoamide succinyltransferase)
MPTNVDIPPLGESVTEAVLLRWIRNEGDYVAADEPLAELETDKANVDLPAPSTGILRRAKEPGERVQVGETIARIDEAAPGTKPPSPSAAAAQATMTAQPKVPAATAPPPPAAPAAVNTDDLRPSVRRMVVENKLSPATITPTGPGGRIIKEDVQKVLDEHGKDNGQVAPAPATRSASAPPPRVGEATQGPTSFDASGTKRVPMTKIRKRIAERLVQAQHTAAILTTFNEVDLSEVMNLRAKYKDRFNEVYGVSLGLMSFFARGVVLALREFPRVNAFLEGEDVVYHDYVNLGIAVSTDRGLAVPVLRNAQLMSFAKVESEIKRLANATREGKLSLQELTGATFTITNGGIFGSLLSTPILSPPESGILGMHAIQKRAVVVNDKIEIRPMMYVALSYDHRLVDGRESVSFLVRLKQFLEDPARLMLEI